MSKRFNYKGKQLTVYLLPIEEKDCDAITSIHHNTLNQETVSFGYKFIYDKKFSLPYEKRLENAKCSNADFIFVFGDKERKNNGVTAINLKNGKMNFIEYKDILKKVAIN